MFGPAVTRFWRGVREPWELMGRMRHDRGLWSRYWRTVLVQAALTLAIGLPVFWVVKHGAEAWNDAFGPDEPTEALAPEPSGAREKTATAPAPPAPPGHPQTVTDAPAPPSGERAATGSTGPAASRSVATGDEEDADEEQEKASDDEDGAPAGLEEKIKALQNAPPEERGKRTAELVTAAVQKAQREAVRARLRAGKKDQSKDEASTLADDREALGDTLDELAIEAEALALHPPDARGESRRARQSLERKLKAAEKEASSLESRGAAALSAAERARIERIHLALQRISRHERGLAGRLGAVLALLTAIWASLATAQNVVLALSRDFHDALSRDLSLLTHVAPEDPPLRPKVRLDLPWVRRKANRRFQFILGFLPGTVLIYIVARLLPFHRQVASVLTALWAAYWWMVMTAGQSARAWSPPETTPRPWYLRAWFFLTDRVFLFRWAVPRAWGRLWEWKARRFYGPSERVEEQPLEFAGLALSRTLILIPGVKLLLRPVFPVCAAHLLVEHAATARLPVPVTSAEVAAAAARAPDSEARAHSGVATG